MSVNNYNVVTNNDSSATPRYLSMQKIRRSVSLPMSPLTMINRLSKKSVLYNQLPHQPIRLSVLKLDRSSFEIEVVKTATIDDLKQAVEAAFSHMPKKGPGKISWPHLWAHFCLCYDGQKLVTVSDNISTYGIKDGDQLHFVRHVSMTYNLIKKRSRKRMYASKQARKPFSRLNSHEKNKEIREDDEDFEEMEKGKQEHYCDQEDECSVEQQPYKLVRCLKRWFSYSRLSTAKRTTRPGCKFRPLRLSCCLLGKCRKLLFPFRKKNNFQIDT